MFQFNPITVKRFRRFRAQRRAWYSLVLLLVMYVLSLGAELLCNDVPLLVRHRGAWFFPVFRFYPEDAFTGNGLQTRTDYRALEKSEDFTQGDSWMLWPPVAAGPTEIVSEADLQDSLRVLCRLTPVPRVAGISVDPALALTRFQGIEAMFEEAPPEWKGKPLSEFWNVPPELRLALTSRFGNLSSPRLEVICRGVNGAPEVQATLAEYTARPAAPKQVRISLKLLGDTVQPAAWQFEPNSQTPIRHAKELDTLEPEAREALLADVQACARERAPRSGQLQSGGHAFTYSVEQEAVRYPFRPVRGHWLGIDDAGRDVFARLLYALRTSLTFGLILVFCSLSVGTVLGFIQGYYGGWVDLTGQRLIEIWSALPFLYVILLMGSIYGPGFWLMIFCYALFNWIGISHYMRAQMLQLRGQPFVEAAICLGLPPWRIVLRHVLPNGLVPLITFFPFSLVGAIGSLAMLDYLGFGLPPPTPSIGQLLQQAQSQRWAWWLILYPSLLLFVVMLLGVFIGEGVRDAFDPRQQGRIE